MPHHIYHTRALVVRGREQGDADKMFELFTEHLGRITVHSRGVRRESSRLRYVLQPLSWIEASVVRGSGGWRITTANPVDAEVAKGSRTAYARVLRIVSLFLPSDIAAQPLFHELWRFSNQLQKDPGRKDDWELFVLIRIFLVMGYWGKKDLPAYILSGDYDETPLLEEQERLSLVREVNRILQTTPL